MKLASTKKLHSYTVSLWDYAGKRVHASEKFEALRTVKIMAMRILQASVELNERTVEVQVTDEKGALRFIVKSESF